MVERKSIPNGHYCVPFARLVACSGAGVVR
jgi:hypothetical protein